MANVQTILGDVTIQGGLTVTGRGAFNSGMTRDNLDTVFGSIDAIQVSEWRIWDAFQTLLTTAGSDDLGLTTGTFGTGVPYITSGDLNALGAFTRRARALYNIPFQYFSSVGNMKFRFIAGMLNAVASVSCTADVEIFKSNGATGVSGGDLVTSAAISINSLTFATYDFLIDNAGLEVDETLDVRITLSGNSATASSHFAAIVGTQFYLPIKG